MKLGFFLLRFVLVDGAEIKTRKMRNSVIYDITITLLHSNIILKKELNGIT